jgi:HSP20 family protein
MALRGEMDDLLSRFFGGDDDGWFAGRMAPLADLSETDTSIQVSVDLPGVNPDDIDIRLSGNTLRLHGERKEEQEEKGRTFHRIERRRGRFSRSITLPCAVVEDEVAAEYKDGVLTVTLPKCEEAKSRKIEVKH